MLDLRAGAVHRTRGAASRRSRRIHSRGRGEAIRSLESENCRAFIARDFERLDQLWSDDFLVNSPINRVHAKRQVLDLLRAGVIAHASLEGTIEVIERHGPLVVAMGSEVVTNSPGGPIINRRFTNLWREEGGTWRIIVRHANLTPDAPG